MRIYTYSEARQKLATLLDLAQSGENVRIRKRNGNEYVITTVKNPDSPLDVDGVDLSLSAEEIVDIVRESRERM